MKSDGSAIGNGSVLVVDDNDDFRLLVATILTADGFQVVTANSVGSALSCVRDHAISAVVSDYHMPELSGLDLYDGLRRLGLSPFFILMSADAVILQHSAGTIRQLRKPFSSKTLTSLLRAPDSIGGTEPSNGLCP